LQHSVCSHRQPGGRAGGQQVHTCGEGEKLRKTRQLAHAASLPVCALWASQGLSKERHLGWKMHPGKERQAGLGWPGLGRPGLASLGCSHRATTHRHTHNVYLSRQSASKGALLGSADAPIRTDYL